MCQSQEEGGRRCATHTRPAYVAAIAPILNRQPIGQAGLVALIEAATAHASTPAGATEVLHDISRFAPSPLRTALEDAVRKGRAILAAQQAGKAAATARKAMGPSRVTPGGWTLTGHVMDQAAAKGFDLDDVIAAIDSPTSTNENRRFPGQMRHMRGDVCVVVDPATRCAITVYENWVMTDLRPDQMNDQDALEYARRKAAGLGRDGSPRE